MPATNPNPSGSLGSYLTGLALALVLTAVPFAMVWLRWLSGGRAIAVIAVTATAQVLVHLRWFLHIGLGPASRDRLFTLAFASVLLFLMVGGTLWIMLDLGSRMM